MGVWGMARGYVLVRIVRVVERGVFRRDCPGVLCCVIGAGTIGVVVFLVAGVGAGTVDCWRGRFRGWCLGRVFMVRMVAGNWRGVSGRGGVIGARVARWGSKGRAMIGAGRFVPTYGGECAYPARGEIGGDWRA